jgi:hypothetical protein
LDDIVAEAITGDTISVADVTYELNGDYLWFGLPGVTLRSASGDREAMVIDGGYQTTEIVVVVASKRRGVSMFSHRADRCQNR